VLRAATEREVWRVFERAIRPESPPPGPAPRKPERNQPRIDVRSHIRRILGVDLTARPGMSALTAHLFFSETEPDLGRFKSPSTFAPSWACVRTTASPAAIGWSRAPAR
jgi:hypothetical protein